MSTPPRRAGRPHASSRAMLEEAAGELFLEQGYPATSVADITRRAGVSRSSFFNYFPAKGDLLWAGFDERVDRLRAELSGGGPAVADGPEPGDDHAEPGSPAGRLRTALDHLAADLPADHIALAFTQAEAMGLGDELRLTAARRMAEVAQVLAVGAQRAGLPPLHARVAAAAWAGALIEAVGAWSRAGAERTRLPDLLTEALRPVASAFDPMD